MNISLSIDLAAAVHSHRSGSSLEAIAYVWRICRLSDLNRQAIALPTCGRNA